MGVLYLYTNMKPAGTGDQLDEHLPPGPTGPLTMWCVMHAAGIIFCGPIVAVAKVPQPYFPTCLATPWLSKVTYPLGEQGGGAVAAELLLHLGHRRWCQLCVLHGKWSGGVLGVSVHQGFNLSCDKF